MGLPEVTEHPFGITSKVLASNALYVHLPAFGGYEGDEFVDGPFIEVLRDLFEDAQGRAGLILDLRGSTGGYPSVYLALASWLFEAPTPLFRCKNHVGPGHDAHDFGFVVQSTPDPTLHYAGKVAVLTDARTFSAGDFTSAWMRSTGRARTFGAPSAGGFGSGDGGPEGQFYLGVNRILCEDLDGTLLEGNPPPVDVPRGFERSEIAAGVDGVIAEADAWIAGG